MKASITFRILYHSVTVIVELSAVLKIFSCTLRKIIAINEVVTSIIRWVNINHLNFAEICFLQQLQYLKVVALNIKVFSSIEIYTATTIIWVSSTICSSRDCFIISNRTQ